MQQTATRPPLWSYVLPALAIAYYFAASHLGFGPNFAQSHQGLALAALLGPVIIGAVFAAVYHAETLAHALGEPFGTLILTVAVTVIELALIVSVMLADQSSPTLVRDTVYAVIMIICTGLVGACILVGGLRFREQSFDITSVSIYLAMLIVLATLTLVLPNYTISAPGPKFSESQLAFISGVTIVLYGVFLYTQTVLHKDYFIGSTQPAHETGSGGRKPLIIAAILLVLALSGVVLLAKKFGIIVDYGVEALGAPTGAAGVVIALLILLPEGIAAINAARADNLQKSLNLALGSSLATIGLTLPAVAAANVYLQQPLELGLAQKETALLVMTLAMSIVTFGTGRTNILFGFLHLVVFATFMFLVFVP